jgi:hypothetical protein
MNKLLVVIYILFEEAGGSITDSSLGTSYLWSIPQQHIIFRSHFHLTCLSVLYEWLAS